MGFRLDKCMGCLYMCECCNNRMRCSYCKPFGSKLNIRFGNRCKITNEKITEKHRFKVGDIVIVRSDLAYNERYDDCRFCMTIYMGKQVTITQCSYNPFGRARYRIKEDNGEFSWSNSMFE